MEIINKLAAKEKNVWTEAPVTIAFLGDSVTQGCFEVYQKADGGVATFFDKNSAYHNYLAQILTVLYPSAPVNIINAGISGSNAPNGLERIDRDVISHSPDLTVVCFGLNDAGQGMDGIEKYVNALRAIFEKLSAAGTEIIFMTPNMMNTDISCHISNEMIKGIASNTSKTQNGGIMDAYMDAARKLCAEMNVPVCDCYAKWKTLYNSGVNITELLANKINHPTREMNWMFAVSLVETMMNM